MKRLFACLTALAALSATGAGAAQAVPNGSSSFFIRWDNGLGPIDDIGRIVSGVPEFTGETEFAITVAATTPFRIDLSDLFAVGDTFGLVLDGVATAWTSETTTGNFVATYIDDALSAGTHTVSFNVLSLAPGFRNGDAQVDFTVTSATAVPLPAALTLLAGGVLAFGLVRRRR